MGRGRCGGNVEGRLQLLHRYVLECTPNARVQHRNGNPLDNRQENLEELPQRRPKGTRVTATGARHVYRIFRKGQSRIRVRVSRGGRWGYASFPDTPVGRQQAEQQAEAWRHDFRSATAIPCNAEASWATCAWGAWNSRPLNLAGSQFWGAAVSVLIPTTRLPHLALFCLHR
jgi:hypothetical protein